MFDQGAFDQTHFDRVVSVYVYGSFVIESNHELTATANIYAYPSFEIEHMSENIINAVRDKLGAFLLESTQEIEMSGLRDRTGYFEVDGKLEVYVTAGRYHVDVIEFTGEFKPGDKIVIDSEKLKITLNGQNALHLMQGDFFDLNTGSNEMTYTDDQTGRSVRIRVAHRDKFV